MQIFIEVHYLIKQLQVVMTIGHNPWDTIAIVIAFNILHDNFDLTTASLLKVKDKSID